MGEVSVEALKDVSIEIRQGEFLVMTGPSGSGKSTILNIVGGLDTVSAGATESPDDLVAALREHDTTVVCLAGTDPTYAEWGKQAVSALREAGASYVILAGRPGEGTVDGVDDSCAIGVDAVDFLTRVRRELGQ